MFLGFTLNNSDSMHHRTKQVTKITHFILYNVICFDIFVSAVKFCPILATVWFNLCESVHKNAANIAVKLMKRGIFAKNGATVASCLRIWNTLYIFSDSAHAAAATPLQRMTSSRSVAIRVVLSIISIRLQLQRR